MRGYERVQSPTPRPKQEGRVMEHISQSTFDILESLVNDHPVMADAISRSTGGVDTNLAVAVLWNAYWQLRNDRKALLGALETIRDISAGSNTANSLPHIEKIASVAIEERNVHPQPTR